MITGIDHVGIYVRDLDGSVADLELLLGRSPEWRGGIGDHRHACFQFANVALDVIAPEGTGREAEKTRAYIDKHGEGIWGIGFAVSDIEDARRTFVRRGIEVLEPATTHSINSQGERREWRIAMARRATTGGITLFFVEQRPDRLAAAKSTDNTVAGLDHVVINTSNPERAVALYGGRLSLDLRLDRSNAEWGTRFLFFRCGDSIVEVVSRLEQSPSEEPDRFGGLAWRVPNAAEARARLAKAGFDLSDLRPGRKPGTHVFTVRSRTTNVPTLILEASAPQG
jgi:catechol 2,3-dioxygenase-like lactoylglutathione lyase family enzyme